MQTSARDCQTQMGVAIFNGVPLLENFWQNVHVVVMHKMR